ncbi:hypothetical protein tb265_05210 [Gemmatimonadetes bacterium T265]|nr:hypothetical protein tb265_05210 [Gemmatimonadetes bacterium T265]
MTAPRTPRPVTARWPAPRDATAHVTLHTVGECRIVVTHAGGTTTLTPASDRLFTLILLLAAEAGRPVPRARVAAWLWPDAPPAAARHALRQLLYRLRRLGLTVGGDEDYVALAPHVVAAPSDVPSDAPHRDAPRTGRCLPGWNPPGDELADWLDQYRATVDAATRTALARALADARAANRDGAALAIALLELDPHHPLARATLPRPAAVRETPRPTGLTPCVGRDDVLATLRTHALTACGGLGVAVTLAAPAGAGADRVLDELAATARTLGMSVATAPEPPKLPRTFARTIAALTGALLDRPGALGCTPDTLRVLRRFATAAVLPDGCATVRRLGGAVAELARAVAAERPLLFALAARCLTPPERTLAAAIARATDGAPVLTVFLALPTSPCTLGLLRSTTHVVPLPMLDDPDATHLATAVARARGSTLRTDDMAWCIAMARGRPTDVITLATACATHPGTRDLPAAIANRLHAGVAALPRRTRQVAALRALVGDAVSTQVIAELLGRHPTGVYAALSEFHHARLPVATNGATPDSNHRDVTRVVDAMVLATLDAGERAILSARAEKLLRSSGK